MLAEDVLRLTSIDEDVTPKWMGIDFFQLFVPPIPRLWHEDEQELDVSHAH
jgi:hypothetical protein